MNKFKLSLLILSVFATLLTSCKKDDDNDIIGPPENTWSIGSKTYTANAFFGVGWDNDDKTFSTFSDDGATISIQFKTRPTANKNYKVKFVGDINGPDDLASDECSITLISPETPTLSGTSGRSGDVVKVTISAGKIRAIFEDVQILDLGSNFYILKGHLLEL
jgi:hypothetical protein